MNRTLLFVNWPISIVIFIAFTLIISFFVTRNRKKMLKMNYILFGFSAITGFLIYSYSYLSSGISGFADISLAVLRGIISTTRMYFVNIDYDAFAGAIGHNFLEDNLWLQILFWFIHLSAIFVLQTTLITLFGRKFIDYFRLRFGFHREVYIIKGSDKYAIMLGESIAYRCSTGDTKGNIIDKKRLVVFLPGENDDPKTIYEKAAHFNGIVLALDRNSDLVPLLKKAGLGKKKLKGEERKYRIILMPLNKTITEDARLIGDYANQKKISPDMLEIFVFTSTEWDREKIEKITQEREKDSRKYPYTFNIISEVDVLTRQMIQNYPPFECSDLIKNGVAQRDFTVMILGFGSVGQSALLHLIMNGQFTGSSMRAIIVDKNIEDLRDCFMHRHPELKLCCNMEFKDFDVQCEKFFNLLKESKSLDYIVISLNNDQINKQTALDIRTHFQRNSERSFPFIAVSEKNGYFNDIFTGKKINDDKIFVFGAREEIYKDQVIIREELDTLAKAVNTTYMEISGGPDWHELDWITQESNRAAADFIPAMLKLSGIDREKAMRNGTLADKDSPLAEILAETEHRRWNAFHAAMGYSQISIDEMNNRFNNFAGEKNTQSHLTYCRRDIKARLHVCLAHWNELEKIGEVYRGLAYKAGNPEKLEHELTRDFKDNDRSIIENIPRFLKKVFN